MATTQIDGAKQIRAGSISNASLAADAAIALSKLAEAVVQADGGQAFTADQSMGGFKLTNLAAPVSANDAARLADVIGFGFKDPVRLLAYGPVAIATDLANGQTIDGKVVVTGDRILVMNNGADAGIYIAPASGAASRSSDADTSAKLKPGSFFTVSEGTTYGDSLWLLNNDAVVLGTTTLTFTNIPVSAGITQLTGHVTAGPGSGSQAATIANNVITNAMIAAAAAIAYSKLAAMATGEVLIGNGGTPTATAITGDVAISATGVATVSNQLKAANVVTRETPAGVLNGSNVTFTLANTPTAGTESVYLNGSLQEPGAGNDYTIAGAVITYLTAPVATDKIRVSYFK